MERAACRGLAPTHPGLPDRWFPERGQAELANEGKVICFGCAVRTECGDYADRTNSEYGMWKGVIRQRKTREPVDAPAPKQVAPPVVLDLSSWDLDW